uniref:Uncharacterized protein n=1 Tax=Timema bartmani TaxID=61472 RepID=A0A7R9EYF3_9NEOP|nr:unnamed protein product [Timema bartmani]
MSRRQNELNINDDEQSGGPHYNSSSKQSEDIINISDSDDEHNDVAISELQEESDNIPKEPLSAFLSLEHNVEVISSGPEQEELEPPDYENQFKIQQQFLLDKIVSLNRDLDRIKTTLRTVNLSSLPDRGVRLQLSVTEKQAEIQHFKEKLLKLQSDQIQSSNSAPPGLSGDANLPTATALLVEAPHGFGKKALETHRVQKALTEEAITQLHSSLNKCPGEDIFAEDPKYLKAGCQFDASPEAGAGMAYVERIPVAFWWDPGR